MTLASILVVDDNPTNLRLVTFILATEGYAIRSAADANEALAALRDELPQLMLLDLQLPGMGGLELARQLKADLRTRDIVVVALTASAMKGDEQKALAAGCDGYITKPIDTRSLLRLVAGYLSAGPKSTVPAIAAAHGSKSTGAGRGT